MDANIPISHSLPKETWLQSAANLQAVAPIIADAYIKADIDGKGKLAADEFMTDMQLACTAMAYVAEFARDRCRIIPVDDSAHC